MFGAQMARRPAWQRIIQRITDAIGGLPPRPPREPDQWPEEPLPPPPPLPPEEPPGGDGGDDYGMIHVVDDFGIDRGTQTWDDWYRDTLLYREPFHQKFGYDFSNIDLIYLLEEILDIEWDWETWRNDYARAQAAAG